MLSDFRRRSGAAEHVVIIAADHGQSLYERGFLGHGLSLGEDQTRIPWVIWGVGGEWPEPVSLSELRGLLGRNLSIRASDGSTPQPILVAPAGRYIFQYMAHLDRPRLLSLRARDDVLYYDTKLGKAELFTTAGKPLENGEAELAERFDLLIDWWESLALREAAHKR
jgi:hypothetical protein